VKEIRGPAMFKLSGKQEDYGSWINNIVSWVAFCHIYQYGWAHRCAVGSV